MILYWNYFFSNYDENGSWKTNGLKIWRDKQVNKFKIELGLIELQSINVNEARKFIKDLDLIIPSKKKDIQTYIDVLKPAHAEGRLLLLAENNKLLLQERHKICKQMSTKKIESLQLKKLRYFGKRLGIKDCKQLNVIVNQFLTKKKSTMLVGKKRKLKHLDYCMSKKRKKQ